MSKGDSDKLLGWAAAGLLLLIVVSLAAAGYFLTAGARARRAPVPPAPKPVPLSPPSRKEPAPGAPVSRPPQAARPAAASPSELLPAFDGSPLDWSCSREQKILVNERPAPGSRIILVILGTDYSIQGTLFVSDSGATLPANFLIKDEGWGQARHFGGQDILLGLAAVKSGFSESALRRAASSGAWWQGKTKPAFQMNY